MLRWRLILGVLLSGAFFGICWLDFNAAQPGIWMGVMAVLLALAASGEMADMLAHRELHPLRSAIYGGNGLIVASNFVPLLWHPTSEVAPLEGMAWPMLSTLVALLVTFLAEMYQYRGPDGVTVRIGLVTLCYCYVGLLLSVLYQVRYLGGNQIGMLALIALVAVVKMGDIGAYTVGRLIGRHKMTPLLSPGKTWEGAAGAIAFATFTAWLVIENIGPQLGLRQAAMPPWKWITYGVLVGGAGLLGDLAESLLKRDLGCKDSSRWMPGFGGVLDILDSILLAGPVGFLCWLAIVG